MGLKITSFQWVALASALFILSGVVRGQAQSRLGNPQYTLLKMFEEFEGPELNRDKWQVASGIKKANLYLFADTSLVVGQSDGSLELTMRRQSGYSASTWTPSGDSVITADFIGAEIMSKDDYSYGIFECSATFASGRGSFPAFWLYNDTMCFESERPETDIAELKVNKRKPTLDNNIWYYPVDCQPQTFHEFTQHPFEWGGTHLFKCIWTPEKIVFMVDGVILKEVYNDGQHWYPHLKQHVILSQQITRYGKLLSDTARIETPQTSRFHWVRVREFFPAPVIESPEEIRESAMAVLDVDPSATDITWELVPEQLFSGPTQGKGRKAEITPASGFHGKGKIYFRFKMPSGETYYADKMISLNGLLK